MRSKYGHDDSATLASKGSPRATRTSNPQGPRLLSIKQACQYSGLTDWCLRNLVWQGKLPFVRFGEKKIFVERTDLDALIDYSKETFGV